MSDNKRASLGYNEKKDNLAVRIDAHKKYSSLSLEDWITGNIAVKKGAAILDIGCGNGNLFPVYSEMAGESGLIVGIDKSSELLREAKNRSCKTPVLLMEYDMNSRLPFVEGSFDHVISSFAIYYAADVHGTVDEIARMLKGGGEAVLIGPTDNNAKELYEFNKKVFGFGRDENTGRRTNRLEDEFYPVFKEKLCSVSLDKIPSKLVFPGKPEFIKYYLATLLFEESAKRQGQAFDARQVTDVKLDSFDISKEMIVLRGKKSA